MNPKREKEVLDTFIFYNPIMLLPSALPPKVPLSLWSAVWPVARDPGQEVESDQEPRVMLRLLWSREVQTAPKQSTAAAEDGQGQLLT